MVLVTDLKFSLDKALKKKIDLMIQRCVQNNPKKDALLLIEGGEGEGKSNLSFQIGYYAHCKTGREFSAKNIFFHAEDLLKYAQSTENQIIIYDEPSLDMMSAEWWKQEQLNIIKLLMTARKNRHFFIFNITKFYKFQEYIIVDRAMGMIHVYSRNEIEPGRFVYIKKKAIEILYNTYRKNKQRLYKKYTSLRGTFPDFVEGIIDIKEYERNKTAAIMSIGSKKVDKILKRHEELKEKIGLIKLPIKTQVELCEQLKISIKTLYNWGHKDEK